MTPAEINDVLRRYVDDFVDQERTWTLQYEDIPIHIIADLKSDRLCVMSPIPDQDLTDPTLLFRLLRANFETAIDARYSIWQGTLYALFLHPLASVAPDQFVDAMEQVVTLVKTTGTTFSSTDLRFGGDSSH
jgi:hypothetical protein